jgi:hypothetical protein
MVAAALSMVALSAGRVAGQESSTARLRLGPDSRVRGLDPAARAVIEAAVACSPTVARLVADFEASDLIVLVETCPLARKVSLGDLRIVAASAGVRYVRIRLRIPNAAPDLMTVLGHELRHAVEVASAAEIRDAASQRAFFLRVGYERPGGGRFETEGAVETGRLVATEIAGCRVERR